MARRPCIARGAARQRPHTRGASHMPRTAIVTGSTSGIGEGIARALAASGCNVVINGFGDPAVIEKIRAGIEADSKVKCLYSNADMTKPDQIESMFAMTKEKL